MIKSRRIRGAGHVARKGEKRGASMLLVWKPEGKRQLVRPRCRWVDNIRMDLGEVRWGDEDRIGLAQERNRWRALVNFPWNAGKLSSGLTSSGLSSTLLPRWVNRGIPCILARAALSPSCRRSADYLISPVKSRLFIREVKDVIKTPQVNGTYYCGREYPFMMRPLHIF
jgi:hypothetical protein